MVSAKYQWSLNWPRNFYIRFIIKPSTFLSTGVSSDKSRNPFIVFISNGTLLSTRHQLVDLGAYGHEKGGWSNLPAAEPPDIHLLLRTNQSLGIYSFTESTNLRMRISLLFTTAHKTRLQSQSRSYIARSAPSNPRPRTSGLNPQCL